MGFVAVNTLGIFPEKVFAATNADLVVYGKIFTAENNKLVEAFAVKDGNYIFVGKKSGAEKFIRRGKTEITDYTVKCLVMLSCGNGHVHYSLAHAIAAAGMIVSRDDGVEKFLNKVVPAAAKKAKNSGATSIFGFGWNIIEFKKNMPTRQQQIFSRLIWRRTQLKKFRRKCCLKATRCTSAGGNYFYNNNLYKAAQQFDKSGKMKFILGTTYEIESWMNVDKTLKKVLDAKKFASAHAKSNGIKVFMDGTVKTGTSFIEPLYLDGHKGIPNWSEEE